MRYFLEYLFLEVFCLCMAECTLVLCSANRVHHLLKDSNGIPFVAVFAAENGEGKGLPESFRCGVEELQVVLLGANEFLQKLRSELKLSVSVADCNFFEYDFTHKKMTQRFFPALRPAPFVSSHFKCPEQDSNLHTVTGTTPSKWRVYQFHHLGLLLPGPQGAIERVQI